MYWNGSAQFSLCSAFRILKIHCIRFTLIKVWRSTMFKPPKVWGRVQISFATWYFLPYHAQQVNSFFYSGSKIIHIYFLSRMHRFYSIGLEKWYKAMIWLDKQPNHLLLCQNYVVMSFAERVNQGESLVNWLDLLTEPPAVCWSVIMGDLSPGPKGVYCTHPKAFRIGPPSCPVQCISD